MLSSGGELKDRRRLVVCNSGALGTVNFGLHGLAIMLPEADTAMLRRLAFEVTLRSEQRLMLSALLSLLRASLGVRTLLRWNSLGTVTCLTTLWARPALLTSAATIAFRQLTELR